MYGLSCETTAPLIRYCTGDYYKIDNIYMINCRFNPDLFTSHHRNIIKSINNLVINRLIIVDGCDTFDCHKIVRMFSDVDCLTIDPKIQ